MKAAKPERIPDYLVHLVTAITQIEKYTAGLDMQRFLTSDMVQDAIIRQFEIIGEAARRIISADENFSQKFPALELEAAYRMRNALAHGYETVNLRTVWDTVEQKLPELKLAAQGALQIYTTSQQC